MSSKLQKVKIYSCEPDDEQTIANKIEDMEKQGYIIVDEKTRDSDNKRIMIAFQKINNQS